MVLQRVWELRTAKDRILSAALLPLSHCYAAGWMAYHSIYAVGLKKRKSFSVPVIGIGSLEVGGLGKTPVTIAIAKLLSESGVRIAISASGYPSPASARAKLAPEGQLDPSKWGDEPALIRVKLPDIPLIVGQMRTRAAAIAKSQGVDALLLDDGFQHLPLARKADLLLWDPDAPNRRCLPAGPMREPITGARRASAFLMDSEGTSPSTDKPVFRFRRELPSLRGLSGDSKQAEWLKGRKVNALCAIGRPSNFFRTVQQLGAILERSVALRDHDVIRAKLDGDLPWIVTEKDAVKLRSRPVAPKDVYALELDIKFDEPEKLKTWLIERVRA